MSNNPILKSDPLGDTSAIGQFFLAQLGTANDDARVINSQLNPGSKLIEIISGSSTESDYTQPKSRSEAVREMALGALGAPEVNIEAAGARIAEKSVVALDANALIGGAEKGQADLIKSAIGDSRPVVSRTAVKEFLAGPNASKDVLKNYMQDIGASVTDNSGRAQQISNLKNRAADVGRSLKRADTRLANFMDYIQVPVIDLNK